MIYRTGNLTVDTNLYRLSRNDQQIDVEPQVFDLLVYLIENRERVVTRNELLDTLWKGRVVSDSALSARLKAARKAVGDSGREQNIIKTVHGRGYQFVALVSERGSANVLRDPKQSEVGKPSIYVGPFQCLPRDEETMSLAEELHDQVLLRFSRRTGIRVIETSGEEDGRQSHLSDYYLAGRIRRLKPKYRVNLTMVWCTTGETVWAEGFSGDIRDPLTFAEEIVNAADAALRFQLNAYDARRLAYRDESEFGISELLTKAAEVSYRISIPDFHHALALIDRALTEHPDDSMALAMRVGLGVTLAAAVPEDLHDEDDDVLTWMADRAIERNNQSDYAFFARGQLRLLRLNDIEGALADAKRCLDLSPSYVDGIEVMGSALLCMEGVDQAIEHFKQAVALSKRETFHAYYQERLALARFFYGDLDNALVDIDSALQLHSGVWMYHRLKAAIFAQQGKELRAKETLGRALDLVDTPHILAVELPLPRAYKQVLENAAPLSNRIS